MLKFQISPSSDYRFVKWWIIVLTIFGIFLTLLSWYYTIFDSDDTSDWLSTALFCSVFTIVFLYIAMLFSNYDISFIDDSITVTNGFRRKRTYVLDEIDKTVYRYYISTTCYIVFFDKKGNKLFKTKYGKTKYFEYLQSLGFTIEKANKISMLF